MQPSLLAPLSPEQSTLRKRFTPSEDALLKTIVMNGIMSWDEIAKYLPGRTGRQCRDRYNNYLSKTVIQKNWTKEEDQIIIEKYRQYGPRWTVISNFLDARSGNNVKNRWYKYILKRQSDITTTAPLPRKKKTQTSEEKPEDGFAAIDLEKEIGFNDFSFLNDEIAF